ncbi:unnamed protein product [Calypogeia fissa]
MANCLFGHNVGIENELTDSPVNELHFEGPSSRVVVGAGGNEVFWSTSEEEEREAVTWYFFLEQEAT